MNKEAPRSLFANGHDETEALLRVPLSHLPLNSVVVGGVLIATFAFGGFRRRWSHDHLLRQRNADAARAAFGSAGGSGGRRRRVELHEFCGLDCLPHLLGLLHLPNRRVVFVLDFPEGLGVTLFLDVVDARFDVQIEASLGMVLPLRSLLVYVPASAIRRSLVIREVRWWEPFWCPGSALRLHGLGLRHIPPPGRRTLSCARAARARPAPFRGWRRT
mmetsp:Transcript_28788/g.79327  ORF Transcript_28788/g.79327 Transcript_28788/m.79327 type:complete len:217 (+) Transcript_28788:803-1453(+)